jgi:hypothetical protein
LLGILFNNHYLGGLGIPGLRVMGLALRLRWL